MIGIDLVKISRMQRMIKRFGHKGLKRFLSEKEILHVKHPRTAAGFWAAKEACSKALGTGIGSECNFHDIHISKTSRGAPLLILNERLIQQFHITGTSLSITHDGDYAIAVVAIESSATNKVQ